MTDKNLMVKLLTTKLISSFVGRARKGDLHNSIQQNRAAAWAHWMLENLSEFKGLGSREYVGINLPGSFHDPKGNGPKIAPHIEIPTNLLNKQDSQMPDRLALIGNGLLFPWWVFSEVTAIKRSFFNQESGDLTPLSKVLESNREGLVQALEQINKIALESWPIIEASLLADKELMAPLATGDFSTSQINEFFPAGSALSMTIAYDDKLRETQGIWASRRVGVWVIRGSAGSEQFSVAVITPRLTTNSLFFDPLFAPDKESLAALLVRALVLRRMATNLNLPGVPGFINTSEPITTRYLRAIVARPGAKLPQASIRAAVHFIQTYQSADDGWKALRTWASNVYLLTITEDSFKSAHNRALNCIRRTEDPSREDIDTILPICWDDKSRVIRATFSLPGEEENTKTNLSGKVSQDRNGNGYKKT